MAEYSIAFSEQLTKTAHMLINEGLDTLDAQRTVLYLSLLSIEIAFKALLEQAGKPVSEIRSRSHRLEQLLTDIDRCEVESEITPTYKRYVPASMLRSISLKHSDAEATVGSVINAIGQQETSQYPNQIRYGDALRHIPADVIAQMSCKIESVKKSV